MKTGVSLTFTEEKYKALERLMRIVMRGQRGAYTKNRRIRKKYIKMAIEVVMVEIAFDPELRKIVEGRNV
jgi:hypothetical protein